MSLSNIRTTLGTAVPAKTTAHLTFCVGDDMVNGLHSSFAIGYWGSIFDWEKYVPDAIITKCKRWDGIRMDTGGAHEMTYRYLYLFREYNYRGQSPDPSTGNETMIGVDMYDSGDYTGEIFLHAYTVNNSTLINGEQASSLIWSKDDTDGLLYEFYREADTVIKTLIRKGYNVVINGVNFTTSVFATGSVNSNDYKTELENLMDNFRTRYSEYNTGTIPFIMGKLNTLSRGAQAVAYNTGLAAITDSYLDYFDLTEMPMFTNLHHPRTITQRCWGRFCASGFYKLAEGGSYPVASAVSINGTLQVGQYVTANYNYSGSSEGETEILVKYADDAAGTNAVYIQIHRTGEQGSQLTVVMIGKFIQVIVIPVSTVSPIYGKPVASAYAGPVIP